MNSLSQPLDFPRGPNMKNRFMLAPMTNTQSHADGCLSDEEYQWLTMRAQGGFGLTMTCAAHVQAIGQGFPGQLGIFSDHHIPGLTKLADGIRREQSLAIDLETTHFTLVTDVNRLSKVVDERKA